MEPFSTADRCRRPPLLDRRHQYRSNRARIARSRASNPRLRGVVVLALARRTTTDARSRLRPQSRAVQARQNLVAGNNFGSAVRARAPSGRSPASASAASWRAASPTSSARIASRTACCRSRFRRRRGRVRSRGRGRATVGAVTVDLGAPGIPCVRSSTAFAFADLAGGAARHCSRAWIHRTHAKTRRRMFEGIGRG